VKKIVIVCLLLTTALNVEAQIFKKALALLDFPYDSAYIEDFGSALLLKPIVAYRSFSYQYYDTDFDKLSRFKPQASIYGGVGAAYKNLQVQLTVPVGALKVGNSQQNDFSALDISLGLKTNSLNGAFVYKQFRGFSLTEGTAPEEILQETEFLRIGLKGFYSFNSSYSINSAYKQTQRQKRPAGSFFLGADAFYLENNYDQNLDGLYNFSLIAGYGYNFVPHKKWYISPMLFVGAGLQHPKSLDFSLSDKSLSALYDLRLSAGYNSKHLIAGFIFQFENNTLFSESARYGMQALYMKLNVAYRFIFDE
jgi:hypothetical protein